MRIIQTAMVTVGTASVLLAGISAPAFAAGAASVSRVSVASNERQGSNHSVSASVSANGRYVVFESGASNLVAGDTNGTQDVFVRDLAAGTTRRVSLSSAGVQGNKASWVPSVSADGRYVMFSSFATNLVPNDTNNAVDAFVRDLSTGRTTRISTSPRGAQGNNYSWSGCLSPNGRYATFSSLATNLLPGGVGQGFQGYLRDLRGGTVTRISVSTSGQTANGEAQAGCPTDDGRYIVFNTAAANLVPGDTNGVMDVFLRDLRTRTTRRISLTSNGRQPNNWSLGVRLSNDGRYLPFTSSATNLVAGDTNRANDVFLRDLRTGTNRRISLASNGAQGNAGSEGFALSADRRYVTFISAATNFVTRDTAERDVFVRDLTTGRTTLVSVADNGRRANLGSGSPTISADGRTIAFVSDASNLVPGDTNGVSDVFVARRR